MGVNEPAFEIMVNKLKLFYKGTSKLGYESAEVWTDSEKHSWDYWTHNGYNIMRYGIGPLFESNIERANVYSVEVGSGAVFIHDTKNTKLYVYSVEQKKIIDTLSNVWGVRVDTPYIEDMDIDVNSVEKSDLGEIGYRLFETYETGGKYNIHYGTDALMNRLEKVIQNNPWHAGRKFAYTYFQL